MRLPSTLRAGGRWVCLLLLLLPLSVQCSEGRGHQAVDAADVSAEGGRAQPKDGPYLRSLRGNEAFHRGDLAEAAWHYRCALRMAPRRPSIEFNLSFVERRLGLAREESSSTLFGSLRRFFRRVTPHELLWWGALLQVGGIALFLIRSGRWGRHRWLVPLCALLVVLGLALSAASLYRSLWAPTEAVVLDAVDLRSEPRESAARIDVSARPGQLVEIIEASDRWARITHPLGVGWVPRQELGFVLGGDER